MSDSFNRLLYIIQTVTSDMPKISAKWHYRSSQEFSESASTLKFKITLCNFQNHKETESVNIKRFLEGSFSKFLPFFAETFSI